MALCPQCGKEIPKREKGSGMQKIFCSVKCKMACWWEVNKKGNVDESLPFSKMKKPNAVKKFFS